MILSESRMLLDNGGDDMIETFVNVAKSIHFPYKEIDLANYVDFEMMANLFATAGAFNEVRVLLEQSLHVG